MAKIFKGEVNFGFVINQTGAQPLDSRSVVQNYAELLKSETFGSAIYNGMTVATIDEQKVYMLIDKTKATSADGWKEVGAGGAVAVDTYVEAVVLATNDNIGQVIFVKTSDETYERAPYIVTGEGSLQKLAASNSDGTGLDADVAKLKETVGDANSGLVQAVGLKVNTSDFEAYQGQVTEALGGKVATGDFTTYQGQVSDALDAKVDDSEFTTYKEGIETYKGEVETALGEKATTEALGKLEETVNKDIDALTTLIDDYSGTLGDVDDRLGELETFVDSHINHESIPVTDIENWWNEQSNQ